MNEKHAILRRSFCMALLVFCMTWAGGCHPKPTPGKEASTRLFVGMTRAEALKALNKGGTIDLERDLPRPPTGDWSEVIRNERNRRLVSDYEHEHGVHVGNYLLINRRYGYEGLDEFHLFFDEHGKLLVHYARNLD